MSRLSFVGDDSGAFLLTSRDTTNWTRYPLPYVNEFTKIASYGDTVIVNTQIRLLQSGLFPRLRIDAPFQLSLTGAPGNYQIQSSDAIEGPWQIVTNLTVPAHGTLLRPTRLTV